jgi:hypothetical protein
MGRLKSNFRKNPKRNSEGERKRGRDRAGPPGNTLHGQRGARHLDMWDAAFPASRDGIKGHEIKNNDLKAL